MQKITSITVIMLFLALANLTANAQKNEEDNKPKTTTIDAWRNSMPTSEQPAETAIEQPSTVSEIVDAPADIESKVLALEIKMMEALKARDAATLKGLMADDFLLAGLSIGGSNSDKVRYISWAVKKLALKSYVLNKVFVRLFTTVAIVTFNYGRQANIGAVAADGDFTVTDVWSKHGDQWLLISHHISPSPKP